MDVNLKYHWQGVRLSSSASLLFEAAWKIQCSIIGFWCHPPINDVTLNASITLDVIEHCKYLTLAKNCFDCASGIDLSTDHHDPRFAPCDFRLTVRTNGMAVYLLLSLRNPFTLMSVSSSADY